MSYEVMDNLKNIDDKYFKNADTVREEFIQSGDSVLQDSRYSLEKLLNKKKINKEKLIVSSIKDLDSYVELTLSTKETKSLPDYQAGEYVVISTYIAGNYYSRPYYIVATNKERLEGYYKIYVLKKEDSIVGDYLRKIKTNHELEVSGPYGDFSYNPIRDCKKIVFIASNYGINAAYSMMLKILEEQLKIELHVIYSVKTYDEILYKDELERIDKTSNKITIDIVISDEVVEGYQYGYANVDLISKYLDKDTSIFISGKEGLLKYLNKELEVLKLPRKYIRYENYLPRCNVKNPKKYELLIRYRNKKFKHVCYNNKTLLDAIEDSRVVIDSISRTGKDNLCNVRVVSGKVKIVNDSRNKIEKLLQLIDPANSYPNSDMKIDIV